VSDLSTSEWPHWDALTPTFKNSFSSINAEAYEAARQVWPNALHFAQHHGLDASDALEPFLKVVESVSKAIERHDSEEIKSLPNYLFRSYQRAIWRKLKEEKQHESLDFVNNDIASIADVSDAMERTILLGEIVARMDKQNHQVFELLILGYSFEEIGRKLNISPNVIRARFSRELRRLAKEVNAEE
jgi:RNA polymerase sigma factor (sigma-70 family)